MTCNQHKAELNQRKKVVLTRSNIHIFQDNDIHNSETINRPANAIFESQTILILL
jgi:hypothetical protein